MTEFFFVATENGAVYPEWNEAKAPPPCAVCGRPTGSDPGAGYEVRVAETSELKDLNHAAPLYVASAAFASWYASGGHSGLEFVPLPELQDRSRVRIASSAWLQPSSGARVTTECEACGYRHYEIAGPWRIDEDAWDGSPFFEVEERRGAMFCSADARAALQSSALSGPVFLELDMVTL